MGTFALKKRKEKFTLFSDHNGSLLRRQPGAGHLCIQQPLMQHFQLAETPRCVAQSLWVYTAVE